MAPTECLPSACLLACLLDFRLASCLPFYKTSVAATAIQALNENFILYKDCLQLQLKCYKCQIWCSKNFLTILWHSCGQSEVVVFFQTWLFNFNILFRCDSICRIAHYTLKPEQQLLPSDRCDTFLSDMQI